MSGPFLSSIEHLVHSVAAASGVDVAVVVAVAVPAAAAEVNDTDFGGGVWPGH